MYKDLAVKDNPTWFRRGHALVNTDIESYNNYQKRVNAAATQKSEIDSLNASINNINDEISGIKDTLSQIITLLQK